MTNPRTIDVKVSLTTSHEYQRHAPGQARGRREARHFGDKEVSFTDALRELTDTVRFSCSPPTCILRRARKLVYSTN